MSNDPQPLTRAFAHGDCEHPRPLLDALSHGFCAVEADVYVVDGQLLIGHDLEDLTPNRTLENLYLDPLAELVAKNACPLPFTLLVDLKDDGEGIYRELRKLLPKYREMLSEYEDGKVTERAVTVLLSGDRPVETLRRERYRLAFIDGRLPDLENPETIDPKLILWVSDNYSKLFDWDGFGVMPEAQYTQMKALSHKAHQAGVRFRLWETPDHPNGWQTLTDAGVDLLNTDDLAGLARFLKTIEAKPAHPVI